MFEFNDGVFSITAMQQNNKVYNFSAQNLFISHFHFPKVVSGYLSTLYD